MTLNACGAAPPRWSGCFNIRRPRISQNHPLPDGRGFFAPFRLSYRYSTIQPSLLRE